MLYLTASPRLFLVFRNCTPYRVFAQLQLPSIPSSLSQLQHSRTLSHRFREDPPGKPTGLLAVRQLPTNQ